MHGRRFVKRRDRPVHFRGHDVVADWYRRRDLRGLMRRLVKDRAVEPDHVRVIKIVVVDLSPLVVMGVDLVRTEVAVRDGGIVTLTGLVDMLRREGRRQRQKWRG